MRSNKFNFGTKANNLKFLRPYLKTGKICNSYSFTSIDWANNTNNILNKIMEYFPNQLIVVRSSTVDEDSFESSLAGKFLSLLEVSTESPEYILNAINKVIKSYGKYISKKNEVLIQPFINDVSVSGVVFSHDLTTGAPYYVVNYDDKSGRTDTVTSGLDDESRTLTIYRNEVGKLASSRFSALITTIKELEKITEANGLDVEFAINHNDDIYIFQIRPIAVSRNWNRSICKEVDNSISQIKLYLEENFRPQKNILGQTTIFGEMPDWNPAEMIGSAPRQLARSLYEFLITDSTWARARAEMGYLDMTNHSLMKSLAGRVYIDVRNSFNSFIPSGLNFKTGEKIINYWLEKLSNNPLLHDKVEFDVAITAFTFGTEKRLNEYKDFLSQEELEEYKSAVFNHTNQLIRKYDQNLIDYKKKLENLEIKRKKVNSFDHHDLNVIKSLLNSCRNNGTKTFSCMARYGFIAESFLRSITEENIWSKDRVEEFRSSIETVLTSFLKELNSTSKDITLKENFMEKYGHLRPGTYDILAPRYDNQLDKISLMESKQLNYNAKRIDFIPTDNEVEELNKQLKILGFSFDTQKLLSFIKSSIAYREFGKLEFTRTVSDIIEFIAQWGEDIGLSRDELSFIPIEKILEIIKHPPSIENEFYFRNISKVCQEQYKLTQAIKTPFLISKVSDIYVIPSLKSKPNFITTKRVQAQIIYHDDHTIRSDKCEGKIVLIKRADPGYDWIFVNPIAGLVTQYGGANSHMAIRCAELGIPAAIGCGEQIFNQIKADSHALLDCASGQIKSTNHISHNQI